MKFFPRSIYSFGFLLIIAVLPAQVAQAAELPKEATPVLAALRAELDRSIAAFKTQPTPAYFLSYTATETHRFAITASFGALTTSAETRTRDLDIDLRVGAPALDNTHATRGGAGGTVSTEAFPLSIEDDPDAIRATVWFQTDRRYKAAVEQLTKVRSNVEVMVADEDKSADFSAAPAVVLVQTPKEVKLDRAAWEKKLRRYSAPFATHGDIYDATASLTVEAQTRWYVNSEDTSLQTTQPSARLIISVATKADDGMSLPLHDVFFAVTPEQLPDEATVLARVQRLIENLAALRTAPVVDPYSGPAILSGRAAGVFFHEVFGHRVEGHRQKRADEGQTFKKMLGQRLLPETFSVCCDPMLENFGGTALGGHYLFDDEGVKARQIELITKGVFGGFLMARIPIEEFPESNGHGRKAIGQAAVSRQSNLVVTAAKTVSRGELKQQLLGLIAEQKKPYGLLIDDIESGFAITDRAMPNAFNVSPIMVYRIYPDGREELVRGANLIGTPLSAFSEIVAADDSPGVFNGICGAESGDVPVSAISPGLLLARIEVQKKEKSQERLPLLPAPLEEPSVK